MDELAKLKELTEALTDSGYLKDQTDSWKYAFDSVSSFVCIVDLKLKVQFINKSFSKLLGVTPLKLVGTSVVDICKDFLYECSYIENDHENDAQKFGVSYSASYDKWVDKTKYTIKDDIDHVIGYMFMFEDVTDKKHAEIMMNQSQLRYRELFNNISSGVAIYEAKDDGRDFIFKDYNKAAEDLTGDISNDIIGKSIYDVRPSIDSFGLIEVLQRVWRTGESETFPAALYEDDTIYSWYENFVYRLPTGELVVVFDDVTTQKLYESKLKESENRFKQIIKNVDKISIQGYDEQRRVIFWNEYSEKLYGYTKEEVLGKQLEDLIIPQDMKESVVQLHNEWLNSGTKIPAGELILVDKAGNDVPVFSSHVINEIQSGKEMFCIDISLDDVVIK